MKFMIGVDCEGVACGVGSPEASLNQSRNGAFAHLQATREADAAARALFDAGAERVIVWDNHGGSLNLHYDLLDERCEIALGVGFAHRWPGLEADFAGVLCVGYHAMDNTLDAPMCHTYSGRDYQWQKVNGREVGELAIDAAVAGRLGVPPIFVSSDDKCLAEARSFFGDVETVQTKQGHGQHAAVSLHPQQAIKAIYDGVTRAVQRLGTFKPFTFDEPITFERRFTRIEAAQAAARSTERWQRIDPYTVKRQIASIDQMF